MSHLLPEGLSGFYSVLPYGKKEAKSRTQNQHWVELITAFGGT